MAEKITMPSRDLQRRTRELLNAVMVGTHVEITRWNKPEAVVVPAGWYDKAQELMANAGLDE